MTSGAFSRRSRLSPKALRVYEDKGLLTPWTTDPSNGYRYYAESQLEPARLIGLLRRLEMPLKLISEIVEMDPGVAMKEIAVYWDSVESDLETKRELVRYLDRYLVGKGMTMFTIETRDTHEQKVATIQERHHVETLPQFISDAMTKLYDTAHGANLETGIPFVVYHGQVNTDADGPIEVCLPFKGSVQPSGDIRIRMELAGAEAFTRITKQQVEFPGILEAYDAVSAWIDANDVTHAGSPREIYFVDWETAAPDDLAVDIAFPIG